MRKLKLDLECLDVQSFTTDEETPANGTVFANTGGGSVCPSTYYGCTYTDFESCATCNTCNEFVQTCVQTCPGGAETCGPPC